MESKNYSGFVHVGKTVAVIFNDKNFDDKVELVLNNYEIVEENGKFFAVKKKDWDLLAVKK